MKSICKANPSHWKLFATSQGLTCWDSPFRGAPFTFKITSPTSIFPLSAAGCPGKSFLTLTMLVFICSGMRLSSREKLNPRPELFLSNFTSNVFSGERKISKKKTQKKQNFSILNMLCIHTNIINIHTLRFILFLLFRATPASLPHSHSSTDLGRICDLCHSSQ